MQKAPGERAKARPCRGFAIPAAGRADRRPIIDDDLGPDAGVRPEIGAITPEEEDEDDKVITEAGALGIFGDVGRVVTKDEEG